MRNVFFKGIKVEIKILNYINTQLNFNSKKFSFLLFVTPFTHCSAYSPVAIKGHMGFTALSNMSRRCGPSEGTFSGLCIRPVVPAVTGVKPF